MRPRLFRPLAAAALLVATAPARADVGGDAKARYEAGLREYHAGDFAHAIDDFKAADALHESPALSFDIAQAYEKEADLPNARRYYAQYLERKPNADDRPSVEATIASIDAKLAQAEVAPAPIVVTNPEPPPPVTAATIGQRHGGHLASELFLGAGAVALLTGGTLNFFASQAAAQPGQSLESPNSIANQYSMANGLWTGALIGYGVGAALAITGVVLYALESPK
ncbi:MAG: outer membrane protein assembly factor BamD [Deltaproteobacteria bacterium]